MTTVLRALLLVCAIILGVEGGKSLGGCNFEAGGFHYNLSSLDSSHSTMGDVQYSYTDYVGEFIATTTTYINPCGPVATNSTCPPNAAVVTCSWLWHNAQALCAGCETCCETDGMAGNITVALTDECHLRLDITGGDDNNPRVCEDVVRFPYRTTSIIFLCDASAAGAGQGTIEPAYYNDERDDCISLFYWHTVLVCDAAPVCVSRSPATMLIVFGGGVVITLLFGGLIFYCHRRQTFIKT